MADEHDAAGSTTCCDICGKPVCEADQRTVPGYVVAEATAGGYCPVPSEELRQMAKTTGQSIEGAWKQVADACADEDWTVCVQCKTCLDRVKSGKTLGAAPGQHAGAATANTVRPVHKGDVFMDTRKDPALSSDECRCPACETVINVRNDQIDMEDAAPWSENPLLQFIGNRQVHLRCPKCGNTFVMVD